MARVIALDAGVLIALFNVSDAHHSKAIQALSNQAAGPFVIHRINLAEALVHPVQLGNVNNVQSKLRQLNIRAADLGNNEPLLLAQLRASYGLKMPDTCALATALHYSTQLETFDKQLQTTWHQARQTFPFTE